MIETTLFTLAQKWPADGLARHMTTTRTVEEVSLLLEFRQAFGGRDRAAFAQAFTFQFDAMNALAHSVEDRVAERRIAADVVPMGHGHLARDLKEPFWS